MEDMKRLTEKKEDREKQGKKNGGAGKDKKEN